MLLSATLGCTPTCLAAQKAPKETQAPAKASSQPSQKSKASTTAKQLEPQRKTSQSLGLPNDGSLVNAARLPLEGPGYRFNPRRDPSATYATQETIQALQHASAQVQQQFPERLLTINDLSLKEGGPIPHHGSHQNGRDVDVLFYLRDAAHKARSPVGAPIDPRLRGWDFGDLADPNDDAKVLLDVPLTWAWINALLTNPHAKVQRIFIAEHIRSALLAHAKKQKATKAVLTQFAAVTCQPSYPHDDHAHIRFFCAAKDIPAGCYDSRPVYPWQRRYLASHQLKTQHRLPDPKRKRAKTTTHAQARKKAGAMHWKVKAFLKAREAWLKQPHPGRPYCR